MNTYEVIHLCMHLEDILSNEYIQHSHQGNDESKDSAHTHHTFLDQLAGDPLDNDTNHVPTPDDNQNNEIVQDISYLIQISLRGQIHNYQYHRIIRYLENTLPPPKEMMTS